MKNKLFMLMVGPFNTRSGYGEHARDMFHSFYDMDKFDIKIMDTRWGDTPRNALNKNSAKDKLLLDRIVAGNELEKQPDICVDVRIPNEFNPVGKFNIGITAGIESTAVSSKWIEGVNKVDLTIVPSEHSKKSFVDSIYDQVRDLPNGQKEKIGELKVNKPMEVLFEGGNLDVYKPLTVKELNSNILNDINSIIKEKFAFLFVGLWGNGGMGEDRKDIANTIKIFYETFANTKNPPALLLKTHGSNFSVLDYENTIAKIKSIKSNFPSVVKLPQVYLLHGELTEQEMNSLYNHPKIKAMISFTHGEGFGRPLFEATLTELPVIASNWSGHLDFLNENSSILINGSLNEIPNSAVWEDILIKESKWFTVDENQASQALKFAYENIYTLKNKAKNLCRINREKFSQDKMRESLEEILEKHMKEISSPVELKLPQLEPVKKSPVVKLPKLESVSNEKN